MLSCVLQGLQAGGNSATIYLTNLPTEAAASDVLVSFGGVEAPISQLTINTDTNPPSATVRVTVPAASSSGLATASVLVTTVNDAGAEARQAQSFDYTYLGRMTPELLSVYPASGDAAVAVSIHKAEASRSHFSAANSRDALYH